jgi:hypothetical protein
MGGGNVTTQTELEQSSQLNQLYLYVGSKVGDGKRQEGSKCQRGPQQST